MKEDTLRVFPIVALRLPFNYSPKTSAGRPSFVVNLAEGDDRRGPHLPLRQASKRWLRPIFGDLGKKKE
jgi:hypothetical protein